MSYAIDIFSVDQEKSALLFVPGKNLLFLYKKQTI